ncbi:MAG: ATP-binding protein [Dehalococcoidia bacterium]|jgi:hypothetical protein|nr:ATP-binding protein [Dehalococcoidia bacterium]
MTHTEPTTPPDGPGGEALLGPPDAPTTPEATGLSFDQLTQLLLKVLYFGEASGSEIAERLHLPYAVFDGFVQHARAERLVEVRGAAGTGSAGYRYAVTDLGRDRGRQYLDVCQYVGPAPVPLAHYVASVHALAAARRAVDRESIEAGCSHLVISPRMFDQIGPAINSGRSLFLYGPPGNGKTVVAEAIGRVLGGDLWVPRAIDVDGQIITLFDPVNHVEHVACSASGDGHALVAARPHDRRWVRVRRPVVVVGGELTLDMLDLTFNPIAKFYEAPIQLKANGGVFVIDDFGRQRVPPRDLLNRWIVPLESRVDYLTLHTGRKFEVPFETFIVFATNLQPETLADEAFLRRIPYKVLARNPTFDEYTRIFALNCERHTLRFDPVIIEYLDRRYYKPRGIEMRACHPRDLVEQVVDLCRYRGAEPAISRDVLDSVCASYFIESNMSDGAVEERPRLEAVPS